MGTIEMIEFELYVNISLLEYKKIMKSNIGTIEIGLPQQEQMILPLTRDDSATSHWKHVKQHLEATYLMVVERKKAKTKAWCALNPKQAFVEYVIMLLSERVRFEILIVPGMNL